MTHSETTTRAPWRRADHRRRSEVRALRAIATGFGIGAAAAMAAFALDMVSQLRREAPAPVRAAAEHPPVLPAHAPTP